MRLWALTRSYVTMYMMARMGVPEEAVRVLLWDLRSHGVIERIHRGAVHMDRQRAKLYATEIDRQRLRLDGVRAQRKGSGPWHEYYWTHRESRLSTMRKWGSANAPARALLERMRRDWKARGGNGPAPRIADARARLALGDEPYVRAPGCYPRGAPKQQAVA